MSDKKHINQSHREADAYRKEANAVDREENDNTDPLAAEKDSELLFQAVSRLQAVRVPGKGRLTMNEAVTAAISQGETFRRWCEGGSLVGEIDVWVEGRKVMSVLPQSPAKLQEFAFKVPSPDAAVLQLTTQVGGEQVVLYNLRLRDVPLDGFSHTESWPNGQHILLTITCKMSATASLSSYGTSFSQSGRVEEFSIRIAVNPHPAGALLENPIGQRAAAATTGDAYSEEAEDQTQAKNRRTNMSFGSSLKRLLVPSLQPISRLAYATGAVALCLLLVVQSGFFQVIPWLPLPPDNEVPKVNVGPLESSITTSGPASPLGRIESVVRTERVKVHSATEVPVLSAGRKWKQNHAKGRVRTPAEPTPMVIFTPTRKAEETARVGCKAPNQGGRSVKLVAGIAYFSNASQKAKLHAPHGAFQTVYFGLLNTEGTEPTVRQGLHNSLIVIPSSQRFRDLGEGHPPQADAVVNLRFASEATCLDTVFVEVRDAIGKILWQGFLSCHPSPPSNQDVLSRDDAAQLMSTLSELIDLTQQGSQRTVLPAGSQ